MLSNGTTNIDSITNFREYVKAAKENSMKAFCFSEHGNIFEWVHKKEEIEKAGMKYLHGIEVYVTEDNADTKVYEATEILTNTKVKFEEYWTREDGVVVARCYEYLDKKNIVMPIDVSDMKSECRKTRDNYHCILISRNLDGVHELNKLVSKSFQRKNSNHFYYMPRIYFDELIKTSDNILISTACLGGILHNGNKKLKSRFIDFLSANKHRCFLEIQHHNDVNGEQKEYNQYLYELHKKTGIPLITGTDTHALNKEHMEGRKVLQEAKNVHFENEDSWDLTFKTYEELVEAYKKQDSLPMDVVLQAIENTNVLADMVEEFTLDRSYKYPHLWEDSEKTFQEKINEGIKKRGVDKYPNYQEYLDRIEYELKAYRHNGAIDFMLLMEDIISWCVENDILVGYGRGSCNGSIIAWLLGITEMDSIKHNLNFDRFMNVERVSLSDIDTDFPPSRRNDVKNYIFSKTGLYCCDIITFNTIAMKGAVRDVCRALYPCKKIPKELQKRMDEEVEGYGKISDWTSKELHKYTDDHLKIANYICENVEADEARMRKEYPNVFKYVDLVIGVIVSVGSHPCGTVVSPFDVEPEFGTFTTSTSEYPISQIYMKEIDSLNFVKLDLLALDTIELINETCKLAGIERLTPDNVDITDVKVWNAIRDDTTQVFQWEGNTGNDYIKKLLSDENIAKFQAVNENVDRMTLLSIGNSAIRPAGASYRDDLANGVVRLSGSKAIDDFLSPTFGYLVFQCQIIEFLHSYCGFTMGEADIVRRHFAKKTGTEDDIPVIKNGGYMKDEKGNEKREHYIDGFVATMKKKYNMAEEESEKTIVAFLQVIMDASRYLFSLNHSQPYSYEGYVSGYLRTYYMLEFLTVAFNINQGKEEKTAALTAFAKKNGIEIKPPVFRHSRGKYFFDKDTRCIYKGIGSLKFFNSEVADELFALRKQEFSSFIDLLITINSQTSLNSRQLEILIKIDFFKEFGDINNLLFYSNMFSKLYGKKQLKKEKLESLGLNDNDVKQFAKKETEKMYGNIDSYSLLKEYVKTHSQNTCNIFEKASYQKEYLGYVDIIDKRCKGIACILSIDTKYTPKLTCYALANGNTLEVKIDKRIFKNSPLNEGDVIKIKNQTSKPRQTKNEEGKWVDVPNTKVWWITDYRKASTCDILSK
jgi:DNA polymerase-3 subunit alpha